MDTTRLNCSQKDDDTSGTSCSLTPHPTLAGLLSELKDTLCKIGAAVSTAVMFSSFHSFIWSEIDPTWSISKLTRRDGRATGNSASGVDGRGGSLSSEILLLE